MVNAQSRHLESIDVVIPAHQAENTIARALRSVEAQTVPVRQVFVVADACTDRTSEIASQMGAHILEVDYGSAGAARNYGIEMSDAKWIAFLDADDQWLSSWVESV